MRDSGSGRRLTYRADERFPLCSTAKLLACAALLARVDAGLARLDQRMVFAPSDLVAYSPVTEQHAGPAGMTLDGLCEAAMTLSDNTAANLIVASVGGAGAVTAFVRRLGDTVTRLDRTETSLNEARPGDDRDTTAPAAMAATMHALLLGKALASASRRRLAAWLCANTTGTAKLRAGTPAGWRVGDKTGSGGFGTSNDVGVLWPPGRAPWLVTVYLTGAERIDEVARSAAIADVARVAVDAWAV